MSTPMNPRDDARSHEGPSPERHNGDGVVDARDGDRRVETPGRFDRPGVAAADDGKVADTRTVPPVAASPVAAPAVGAPAVAAPAADAGRPEDVRPVVASDRESVVARERERFGGMRLGTAFFGWLAATGLAVLVIAILAAAGVAFGVTSTAKVNTAVQASANGSGTAKTVGLIGAIVLLVILFVAYYCGGYVAGRMARFNGLRQGFAVWLWAIFTSAIIAAVAAIAGGKYNVLSQLNLPRIPVDEGSVTTAGVIAIVAAILAALLGALVGGIVGTRYHRMVDAVGFAER